MPSLHNTQLIRVCLRGGLGTVTAGRSLKIEAVMGGAPVPIRVLPSTCLLVSPSTGFELAPSMVLNPGPSGGGGLEVKLTLELEIDLSRALPGLMHLNLWSDAVQASEHLAAEHVLILGPGQGQLAAELAENDCSGEDLLSDLADVLEEPVQDSLGAAHLLVLMSTARGILDWAQGGALPSLELVMKDRLRLFGERRSAVLRSAIAARRRPAEAGQEESTKIACSKAEGTSDALFALQPPVCTSGQGTSTPALTAESPSPCDPVVPHPGVAWPVLMLLGIIPSIKRSFTDGKGKADKP